MTSLELDSLALRTMASGHTCLDLTERVSWEGFPIFADRFLQTVGGHVTRRSDAVDMRLWEVRIDNQDFCLAFDDFPLMVGLESSNNQGDELLRQLYSRLKLI